MIPETGHDHSLRLYRCRVFPTKWELVQRFATDEELCDAILVDRRAEELTILCSETKPDNQLYVRYRRYTLCHAVQETAALPLAEADTLPAAAPAGPFELLPDETYNLQHQYFDFVSRNAGPLFVLGEQVIHPTQVSPHQRGLRRLPAISRAARQLRGAALRGDAPECGNHRAERGGCHRRTHLLPG